MILGDGVTDATVITAGAALLVGVLNWWNARGKNKIQFSSSLSASEAKFRNDLMTAVTNLQERLDACEDKHKKCEQRADEMEGEVQRQSAEIESLRSQVQALMP